MTSFSEKGILKLSLFMGLTEKTLRVGDNLGDDKWHTVKYERRGMIMSLGIDHHRPVIGNSFFLKWANPVLSLSLIFVFSNTHYNFYNK